MGGLFLALTLLLEMDGGDFGGDVGCGTFAKN
jgi:hypothetical protein